MFKKTIKEYFSFSSAERNGIIILLLLIILFQFIPYIYSFIANSSDSVNLTEYEFAKEISAFELSLKPFKNSNIQKDTLKNICHINPFDPNTIQKSELLKMGLNKRLALTLINYRNKGGRFKHKTDLLKLYGMDTATYNLLEPYLIINNVQLRPIRKEVHLFSTLEINSADSAQLVTLPGIGLKFAHRIIKFRKALGGFYNISQIREVYGMSDSIFNLIQNRITVDTIKIKKIDLNSVSLADLKYHPYLSKYQATAIIKYRSIKKQIIDKSELCSNNILPFEVYKKLFPYLK